jgi:hypothetical protein
MAEAGVYYPETLAITYKPPYEYKIPKDARITILNIETKTGIPRSNTIAFLTYKE